MMPLYKLCQDLMLSIERLECQTHTHTCTCTCTVCINLTLALLTVQLIYSIFVFEIY